MGLSARNAAAALALCLIGLAPTLYADTKHTATGRDDPSRAEKEDDCWRIAPAHIASGYVDLSFTVTTEGTVRDPSVVETVLCGVAKEDPDPNKLRSEFEKASIRAVLKYKYKPRIIDGDAVEVPGVKTRISFRLEDKPEENDAEEGAADASDGA